MLYDEAIYGGRAGYFRSPSFPGEVTLFPSGKMIGVGARSVRQALTQLEFVRDALARSGIIKHVTLYPKIHNLVATIDLDRKVSLLELTVELNLDYEPEQFPGAIMRLRKPSATTVLLFSSGKTVVTGVKSDSEPQAVREYLEDVLAPHGK